MQNCLEHAVERLRQFSKPWQAVVDPAGAFILTLGRLGESCVSQTHLHGTRESDRPAGLSTEIVDSSYRRRYDEVGRHGQRPRLEKQHYLEAVGAAASRTTRRVDHPPPTFPHQAGRQRRLAK